MFVCGIEYQKINRARQKYLFFFCIFSTEIFLHFDWKMSTFSWWMIVLCIILN